MDRRIREMVPVTPLELIFDLVIVFALSQLTNHLVHEVTFRSLLEMVVLVSAIYTVWAYTSFEAIIIDVHNPATVRMILVVTMLGIFMISGIEGAFGLTGWRFAIPFMMIQITHAIFTNGVARGKMMKRHFRNMALWIMATVPLWLVGAALDPDTRLIVWGIAAIVDVLGTWLAHPVPGTVMQTEHVEFDAGHMLERSRLFLIICLGEAIFTLAETLLELPMDPMTIMLAVFAFWGIISLWAMYFWGADEYIEEAAGRTDNPIMMGRLMMNGLIVIVAALIFYGVGIRIVLENPLEPAPLLAIGLLVAGAVMYIATQTWYSWFSFKLGSPARVMALVTMLLTGAMTYDKPAFWTLVLISAQLVILTIMVVPKIHHHENETDE